MVSPDLPSLLVHEHGGGRVDSDDGDEAKEDHDDEDCYDRGSTGRCVFRAEDVPGIGRSGGGRGGEGGAATRAAEAAAVPSWGWSEATWDATRSPALRLPAAHRLPRVFCCWRTHHSARGLNGVDGGAERRRAFTLLTGQETRHAQTSATASGGCTTATGQETAGGNCTTGHDRSQTSDQTTACTCGNNPSEAVDWHEPTLDHAEFLRELGR
jgi:hypothetical protein